MTPPAPNAPAATAARDRSQPAAAGVPPNPYLLLTPGPLTTTPTVKAAMLRDWCTWDADYNRLVEEIRHRLVRLATHLDADHSAVLMQGSGTFSVEATIGSLVPEDGKLLVLTNGAYGDRIVEIARRLRIPVEAIDSGEVAPPDPAQLDRRLASDTSITHVAVVHCETTTGMLNPVQEIGAVVARHRRRFIVDAMSSFGGIAFDMAAWNIDVLVSSANKCIQGVPGFGFVVARREILEECRGRARSLALDLHDQWACMEANRGKWRFTSPTHTVRAFDQALIELDEEGGIPAREARYRRNQAMLVTGMEDLGFRPLLAREHQSPIITSFHYPEGTGFGFEEFYQRMKSAGFVLYPGKVSRAATFRIGTIGDVHEADIARLLDTIGANRYWLG